MKIPVCGTTYVLPIRRAAVLGEDDDLPAYLDSLSRLVLVIVADGSPPEVFAHHAATWPSSVVHVPIDADRRADLNGKVAGVVTALRRVRTAKAIVADDDVRYDPSRCAASCGCSTAPTRVSRRTSFARCRGTRCSTAGVP